MRFVGKLLILVVGLVLLIGNGVAQEIQFSQFGSNPVLYNPGAVGTANAYERAVLNFKTQWGFNGSPYQTLAFAFDKSFFQKQGRAAFLGAGISAFRDQAGDGKLGKTQVGLAFSGILNVNRENKFAIGISGNFNQRSLNYDQLKWGNQYNGKQHDPNLASNELNLLDSRIYVDFGLGGVWDYTVKSFQMQVGASYYRISPQTTSLYQTNNITTNGLMNFTVNARKDLKDSKLSVLPGAMFSINGPLKSLALGTMLRYGLEEKSLYTGFSSESAISFGLFYRIDDALIPRVQYEFKNLALGMSYDVNASSLSGPMRRGTDSLELFLKFQTNKNMAFNKRSKNKRQRP